MTDTPEFDPSTPTLVATIREAAGIPGTSQVHRNHLRLAAVRLQSQHDRLIRQQALLDEAARATTAIAKPRELTREDAIGMVLSRMTLSNENTDPVRLAKSVREYTQEQDDQPSAGEWALPQLVASESRAEYVKRALFEGLGAASVAWSQTTRGVFDDARARSIGDALMAMIEAYADGEGPHVEIGGQKMTQAQFDAARYPLLHTNPGEALPPTHGLAVGDALSAQHAAAAPEGAVFSDKDGDRVVIQDGALHWTRYGNMSDASRYAPYTVTKLPEPAETPEDTTPRVGDRVRVVASPVGADSERFHADCAGRSGVLSRSAVYPGCYLTGSPAHVGPLSDFELVERAKPLRRFAVTVPPVVTARSLHDAIVTTHPVTHDSIEIESEGTR